MIIETLKEAILSNIGPLKTAPNRWHKRHCMLCHTQGHGTDTRNRFGIQFNPQSIAINCFNCKFSTGYTEGKDLSKSFIFFLGQLHIDKALIDELKFEIHKQKHQIASVREGDEISISDKEAKFRSLFEKWQPMSLPPDAMSISTWLDYELDDPDFLDVVSYAVDRKLRDLGEFYWSPDTKFNMNKRLLIPYYYKEKIVGYTSRLCYDTVDKTIPKYHQKCPPDFVYNLDSQNGWARKYVIVTEGVLDAWTVDGISTLGEISQGQIDIINRLQKQIIVCPDNDKSGKTLVDAAIKNNWAVSFPKWRMHFKDATAAAEKYGQLLTTHSIISSSVTGELKIQVAWNLDQNDRNKMKKYE
jgi:hypothetical protein